MSNEAILTIDARFYSEILLMPDGTTREIVPLARAERWFNEARETKAKLRDEEERHALLQSRCHEGFPSVSDGIFDALAESRAYAERLRYLLTIYQHAWKHDARIPSNIEAQAVAVLADLAPSSSASQQPTGEKS